MIGRADIEESKSNVAMNAWLPQASYPCGNFSDTSSLKFERTKINVNVQYNGGLLPDIIYTVDPMLFASGNPFKCHEEVLYLQPVIPPTKRIMF